MYRLYNQVLSNGKFSEKTFLILAKDREGSLSKKYPNRYLEGICVGDGSRDYKPGYFSRAWGKKRFKVWDGQIELISKSKLFEHNGDIYIKGITKYDENLRKCSKRIVFWKLDKNGTLELVEDWEDRIREWSKLSNFKIKNK